jgi:hypothetical protein
MSNVEASSLSFQKISCFRTNVPLFYFFQQLILIITLIPDRIIFDFCVKLRNEYQTNITIKIQISISLSCS